MQSLKPTLTGIALLCATVFTAAQNNHFKLTNQVSTYVTLNAGNPLKTGAGLRYIPSLSISDSLQNNRKIDAELSVNLKTDVFFSNTTLNDKNFDLKPYRIWIRYSTSRFELRLGLQKISFGSASVIRPLMWFDRMDYRDPLQLTDGANALLARYYFQNNANIWLWALYGNNKPLGWNAVPSSKKEPEIGGRIQLPVPKGEIALSVHHREADFSSLLDTLPFITRTVFPENKIGIDAKWDIGPGLGFEYVLKHNDTKNLLNREWETYLNLNADYTLTIGNGLTMSLEFFRYNFTNNLTKTDIKNTFTALTLNYPFGLMNSITTVLYYNWEPKQWSSFISLQRKYDYWTFYLMGFWNPENSTFISSKTDRNLFAGKGFQIMAVVNF